MARRFLFSCMRNEAPYALEWVAYHRMIGFDRIVVCSNDCEDNTPELLDALAGIGWVTHIPNPTPEGVAPQLHACARIGERPPWIDGDWVMFLDTDEFLNIHEGAGHLDDLLGHIDSADGVCVHWRLFGSGAQAGWQDLPVIERFQTAASAGEQLHEPVKTLFRWSPSIEALHSHRPTLRPSFRDSGRYWVHGEGEAVPEKFYYTRLYMDGSPALRVPLVRSAFQWAQVNHYAVRSWPEFAAKARRGSGIYDDRHDQEYWKLYNQNDVRDLSIQRHLPALREWIAEALRAPQVHLAQTRAVEHARQILAPSGGEQGSV